jgi:hypothetical protein
MLPHFLKASSSRRPDRRRDHSQCVADVDVRQRWHVGDQGQEFTTTRIERIQRNADCTYTFIAFQPIKDIRARGVLDGWRGSRRTPKNKQALVACRGCQPTRQTIGLLQPTNVLRKTKPDTLHHIFRVGVAEAKRSHHGPNNFAELFMELLPSRRVSGGGSLNERSDLGRSQPISAHRGGTVVHDVGVFTGTRR